MTMTEIKNAMELYKQLYIDSSMVEVLFFDQITETIQVKFLDSGIITYVTKSSLSDRRSNDNYIILDDLFILRYEVL